MIHTVVQEAFLIQYLWYNDNTHTVSVFECTSGMWWLCWYEAKHGDAYTAKYKVQTVTSTTDSMYRPIAWWNVLRWLMLGWWHNCGWCDTDNHYLIAWYHPNRDKSNSLWIDSDKLLQVTVVIWSNRHLWYRESW